MKDRKNKYFVDSLIWVLLMFVLAGLAFVMLVRDGHKQYGAVSFGMFPDFTAVTVDGKPFDQHKLRGQLTAVIISDQILPDDIATYLHRLSQVTAHGKKYLVSYVLSPSRLGLSDQVLEYFNAGPQEYSRLSAWSKGQIKNGIILVDQNGVIRGIFDIQDKLERINFEGAVKGIL